jgi:hypothetical protein
MGENAAAEPTRARTVARASISAVVRLR